ncbi:hypothetical protein INT47_010321 [Mucor saturninus]|uniref:WW domain-containing protein n=1 Tax=Mucor saturninus TaxID=64648 RepID=A0A8H7QWL9_9FUNG|nr:hypothetical protein INT47_010321 [Mucor saturninus]
MDRRYDQAPRDRYLYSRGRFDDRPHGRDEGYYRRDDGPWMSRYPQTQPAPQAAAAAAPAPRRHHDGYSRDHYSRRQPSPTHRPEENKHLLDEKRKEDDDRKPKVDVPLEPVVVVKKEQESVKKVYKEAVVTFDSDDEAERNEVVRPPTVETGNDSDETVTEKKSEEDLPDAWATHVSDKGEKYYYNKKTRESVWDKPTSEKIVVVKTTEENKRKFVLPDRERTHHPYPRRYDNRPLPHMPYDYHRPRYHHHRSISPPPPSSSSSGPDRYYRHPAPRDPWLHHPPPYRHHLDYAPLPPPPPPRWMSARRLDFDRREPLPHYMHRNTRDYR